ncbi:MAG: SMP-30/gluconolactonase/LRE family protein [Candidatus Humimicrobiaceae bacterium]
MNEYKIGPINGTESIAGETPVWDTEKKVLYWIDFIDKKINCLDPYSNNVKSLDVRTKVGTVVLRENGGLLTATGTGFNFVDPDSGEMVIISHPEADRPNNRFNDGKCDCRGRLWISTVSQDFENGCATMEPLGSFYCLDTGLKTRTIIDRVIQVNGIAWSADNKKMYLVDTCAFEILQFDFDAEKGQISNRKTAVRIPEEFSYPDGICIDLEGKLWQAHWGGYQLSRWDPDTGKLIEKVPVPAPNVTCCTFGGPDMDELYITTASFGMTEEDKKRYHDAGKLFKLKPGVKGPKPYRFKA